MIHVIRDFHPLSSTFILFHPLASSFTHFHPLTFTFIHFHQLSSTFIHFYPLSSPFIHFHPISSNFIHFHSLSSTFIHWSVSSVEAVQIHRTRICNPLQRAKKVLSCVVSLLTVRLEYSDIRWSAEAPSRLPVQRFANIC